MIRGTVKAWNDEEGWGVLTSPDAPGEVWAHFSHLEMEGFKTLDSGADVLFEFESVPGGQDGYAYRATRVVDND